jgi:hypothetical protein
MITPPRNNSLQMTARERVCYSSRNVVSCRASRTASEVERWAASFMAGGRTGEVVILKGLVGLLIGVGYGVLAGAAILLLGRLEPDTSYPGPLIPDANEMRGLLTFVLAAVVGLCGALSGLAVGLTGAGKAKAGVIGFGIGLVALSVGGLAAASWREWLTLPVGLSLVGVAVSAVTGKVARPG